MEKKAATREQLNTELRKRRYDFVDLPNGLSVRIRSLTEFEKSNFEIELLKKKSDGVNLNKLKFARQRLISLTAVDNDGELLFDDKTDLNNYDGAMTAKIYDEARIHCGFEDGDIEGLVKNSSGIVGDDSPTDSPATLEE